jgi:hypothetical protein
MNIKKLRQGICDNEKCNDGWIQFDKDNDYYYCMSCHKIWREDEWDYVMELYAEKEYHIPTEDENLSGLNNL